MQSIPSTTSLPSTTARSTDQTSPPLFRPYNHFPSSASAPVIGGIGVQSEELPHVSAFKPVGRQSANATSPKPTNKYPAESYYYNQPNTTTLGGGTNYFSYGLSQTPTYDPLINGGLKSSSSSSESTKSTSNFVSIQNSTFSNIDLNPSLQSSPNFYPSKMNEPTLEQSVYNPTCERRNDNGG